MPRERAPLPGKNLFEVLEWRSRQSPNATAFGAIPDGSLEATVLTYAQLDLAARGVAARLQALALGGERALLVYPAGLEFLIAFLGCAYANVTAVPVPPAEGRPERRVARFKSVLEDAQPRACLTTSAMLAEVDADGALGSRADNEGGLGAQPHLHAASARLVVAGNIACATRLKLGLDFGCCAVQPHAPPKSDCRYRNARVMGTSSSSCPPIAWARALMVSSLSMAIGERLNPVWPQSGVQAQAASGRSARRHSLRAAPR